MRLIRVTMPRGSIRKPEERVGGVERLPNSMISFIMNSTG